MSRQLLLPLRWEYKGVTPEQACIMCHLSSECGGCCLKCDKAAKKCAGQSCSQSDRENQGARWATWMYLVKEHFQHLRKFVPKKYLKI